MSKYTEEQLDFILSLDEWEVHFIKELNDKLPTLKYIGGYTGSENKVVLQCKKCGETFTRTATIIRKPHYEVFTCNGCEAVERKERLKEKHRRKQIKKLIDEYNKNRNNEIKIIYKKFKTNTIAIRKCRECGNDIYVSNTRQKLCNTCAIKHNKKSHSNKPLRELYKRDKGICYICGSKCDYEDYTYRGNIFIAGNNYPSIDHVIPLCKGGKDDWSNIKLAHRICNSIKSAKDRKKG